MGGVVDIDHKAILSTIELYANDKAERKQLFEDILLLWSTEQKNRKKYEERAKS